MVRLRNEGSAYTLPYLLTRDAGGSQFTDVLIIGAGSGNDVNAALAFGAKHVDAVEIDPRIYELGRKYHPESPYASKQVSVYLTTDDRFCTRPGASTT